MLVYKKILVTGAGGFIGSHLTELLVEKGFKVKAFLRYNSKNNWGWLEQSEVKNDIEIVTGDIRDYDAISKSMKDCYAVFHLAALIGIPYSYVSPLAYIKTNVEGTYNVLEASKNNNLEQVLVTSTSETYGTAQYVPIDEKHPIVGQSPYSASKIGADQLALSYYKSFNLPVKIVRPFNTFGPRQSLRAVIPTIISQLMYKNGRIELGNLNPTRDLLFVKDTVSGFYKIFKEEIPFGEVFNLGSNSEISIEDLVKKISLMMNIDYEIIQSSARVRPDGSEVERLLCDYKKINKAIGWKPEFSLEEGLKETIEWLKINCSNKYNSYNV
jgi:NAD dependent epimerase/dehydratase